MNNLANKRLKKKQQQKQTISLLEQVGLPKKEIKQYRNRPEAAKKIPAVKKKLKSDAVNERARRRNKELTALGYSTKEIQAMRFWGEKRYNEALSKKQKQLEAKRKRELKKKQGGKDAGGLKLLILWKDVTENVGREYMEDMLQEFEGRSAGDLLHSANGWRNMTFGEIGQYANLLIPEKDLYKTLSQYPDYTKVYYGAGIRYNQLLEKLNFMMLGLYQAFTKELFLKDVILKMAQINRKTAERLAYDFDIRIR